MKRAKRVRSRRATSRAAAATLSRAATIFLAILAILAFPLAFPLAFSLALSVFLRFDRVISRARRALARACSKSPFLSAMMARCW